MWVDPFPESTAFDSCNVNKGRHIRATIACRKGVTSTGHQTILQHPVLGEGASSFPLYTIEHMLQRESRTICEWFQAFRFTNQDSLMSGQCYVELWGRQLGRQVGSWNKRPGQWHAPSARVNQRNQASSSLLNRRSDIRWRRDSAMQNLYRGCMLL
jgi:hypothetical protein